MSVPLYTCGLAQPGCDESFHEVELQMKGDGLRDLHVSGTDAIDLLSNLAFRAYRSRTPYPIPHDCPHVVKQHLQECDSRPCDHDKTCLHVRLGWLSLKAQNRRPYAGRLSDGVAQRLVDFLLADIDALRHRVSQKLLSHGDAVLRRWRKMSKDKRGKFLSAVSPRVFGDWPLQISICPNEGCYEVHIPAWSHGAWLNSRDFSEDWMKLISVLRVRSAHHAAAWAAHDFRASYNMNWMDNPPSWYSDRCVFICGSRFGQLVDYDSDAMHQSIMVGFPTALTIFQGQHEILCLLEKVLESLLAGVEPSGSVEWSSLVTRDLHSAGHDVSWNSYIHEPFTTPVAYSADHLYQKSTERLNMIKDELMLLQTDPSYAQELIKMRRIAISNSAPGSKHELQYQDVGSFLMVELWDRFEMWYTISSRCFELMEATARSNESFSSGSKSPPEVTMQIMILEASIQRWREVFSVDFEERRNFTNLGPRQVLPSGSNHQMDTIDVESMLDRHKPLDRLKWHIKQVRESAQLRGKSVFGYAPLFATIEREEAAARIMDQLTREYLNDMMILEEIFTHVGWVQRIPDKEVKFPWLEAGDGCCILGDPKTLHSRLKFAPGWQQRIGALAGSLMDAPWPKGRKDLSWLAKATLTRERLAKLWQCIFTECGKA